MAKGPSRWNVVSVTLYLIVISSVYLSYKYIPIVWKKSQLENMVKEYSYGVNRNPEEYVRNALIERAENELEIKLELEDIFIEKFPDRVRMKVIWRPVVVFLLGQSIAHEFEIKQSTVFY